MSVTGIRTLSQLAKNLERLARVPSQIASDGADAIAGLIQRQFDEGRDPYGNPWARLKPSTIRSGRRPPPLTDTSDMRDAVKVTPMAGAGIQIVIDDPKATYHQHGTARMPARPILPEGTFPKTWNAALQASLDARAQKAVDGK